MSTHSTFLLLFSLFQAILVTVLESHNGVDFAGTVYSESDFECLKKSGYDFIITRAWHSYGAFDDTAVDNLKNAQKGGFSVKNTSVYMACFHTSH